MQEIADKVEKREKKKEKY